MDHPPTSVYADLVSGIDHVAIAVSDIEASIAWYAATLGYALAERNEVSGELTGMILAVMNSGTSTIVLIQGTSPESQISRFIEEFGPGMHHIALAIRNLDEALERIGRAGGYADTPVVSNNGIRQIFLERDTTSGIRIELIERNGGSFSRHNIEQLFRALEEKELY